MEMSWKERLMSALKEGERTHGFPHNVVVRKLYYKLLRAVEEKNSDEVKKILPKMGF
jgi:hypothetical protein